jgi:hypothetical protein
VQDAEATLRCDAVPPAVASEVAHARNLVLRRERVLGPIRAAIRRQISERLPFDEPRTEEGQEDGSLRPAWLWAYRQGRTSYTVNDDRYRVYDLDGRPLPPQVCIDFIIDTLERASGTWWHERGQRTTPGAVFRPRAIGKLDFEAEGIENRRSVEVFVDFAWERPEWFDTYDLLPDERIPFYRRRAFFDYLHEHRDRFVPGDIVTIHGRRDDDEVHYHSFFVYESDPVTGMPTLTASNAGRPRIRTWEKEMLSAPLRSIRSRIRPRLSWLESQVVVDREVVAEDPASGPSASG